MPISRKFSAEFIAGPEISRQLPLSLTCGLDETRTTARIPRLLVSVRSAGEAAIALSGGADLIDVKEPRLGSLGFAGAKSIGAVSRALAKLDVRPTPLSAALGELSDWDRTTPIPKLPANVTFAKLGLSACRARANWQAEWVRLRNRFEANSGRPLCWIAVYYVDASASGPSLADVLDAARQTNCAGLLLDTFDKSNGRLFDHIPGDELQRCREVTTQAEILLAVAGGLTFNDLTRVVEFAPDIVAVRGAACLAGERSGRINLSAVQHLHSTLQGAACPRERESGSLNHERRE